MQKTTHEAQIQLVRDFLDLFVDLSVGDEDISESELDEIEESMDEIVGLIFDSFDLKVIKIDDRVVTCQMTLFPDADEE